jgi:peptidoglycan-associated lipoprotein
MKTIRQLLVTAGLALALAGCGSSVKLDENATAPVDARTGGAQGAGAGGADASGAGSRQVTPVTIDPRDALNDPASPLAKRSIYFDFDSFAIREEYRGTLEAHARFLNANKGMRVVIQGNTDERGTREYNLALGQKRAEAVRRALAALGVAEGQMEAVSFGEEKPRATGSDETAFAENRRADLAYQ